ncbi:MULTISPECIES: DNA-directed RNA polymerase subunit H [Methanosphaera]|uniref:DNA-directed RNA polymerase subunit Rpo5 n=1 Tax=Methanosphaera stadtmanae (strain ATCC 43021 / DSM 3091 / JCM 11832 / MCB-3) TaxID=339860 RepID=RPO5_METST|nr:MULTISPECIES: DNA-directed RNA polymerase subunit H [Methanosphaera]Q2NEK1.1 RecName: Full=DNA-directed RNA polymerase subunit Rpo5; AltName: Full=DNA-directed RNA polymerase subunit H [Methanosphaera stadtmanae DSM 3091]ABC57752.1 RpoH [Methanosphaera stadtmanae DSM 3091]MDO5822151.1 DNA-directed RNA polymerase subunit H [Methanosphaera sp.]MEE0489854.1 DNA-directed RNA polymerase subunit H [Methanosphaera stadtmanae]
MKADILQHKLVPEHTILSEEEAQKVLDDLNVRLDQIPKILPTDPVVKAIDAKVGDILKITRKSETAGIFVAYRVVRD